MVINCLNILCVCLSQYVKYHDEMLFENQECKTLHSPVFYKLLALVARVAEGSHLRS